MGILDRFKKPEENQKPEKASDKKPEKQSKVKDVKKKKPETRSFDPNLVPSAGKDTSVKKDSDKKGSTKTSSKKVTKENTKDAYKVLVRPIITEKATSLSANSQYVFEVSPNSNKVEIKKAIKSLYGVEVVKVRIINQKARRVQYGRTSGTTKSWKKAVINLKPGEKIEIHEGI